MNTVSTRPDVGQGPDPCAAPDARATIVPPGDPAPPLNFSDAAAVRAWLVDVEARVGDLAAVAKDQSARRRDRRLGPKEARRLRREARGSLADLIAYARAGLDLGEGAR